MRNGRATVRKDRIWLFDRAGFVFQIKQGVVRLIVLLDKIFNRCLLNGATSIRIREGPILLVFIKTLVKMFLIETSM